MTTIYDTLLQFFSKNPDKIFTRKDVYTKFKDNKVSTIHSTLGALAREKHIISINPRGWKYNTRRHEI